MNEPKAVDGKKNPPFIKFNEDGTIFYRYQYTVNEDSECGMFSVYIPAYDMAFSAKNMEDVHTRARYMVKSFYNYWLHKMGVKQFVLQIHKLGFRSPHHDLVMKELMNRSKRVKTKFSTSAEFPMPSGFDSHSVVEVESTEEHYA